LALQHFDINTLKDKYLNVIQDVVGWKNSFKIF
jgi:hypothetical protein